MTQLKPVKLALKAFNKLANTVINAVNERTLVSGDGITLHETPTGVIISVLPKNSDGSNPSTSSSSSSTAQPWLTTPSGETAGWHTVDVIDAACVKKTMFVWSGTPA